MKIPGGNINKDNEYLSRLTKAIEDDPTHPRHHGIAMQAHHIVSAKGVALSGRGNNLVQIGYDINALQNLVFIPCTLQGACHLGTQVHRGNHSAPVDQDKPDNDMDKSITYHDVVRMQILDLALPLAKECSGSQLAEAMKEVHKVSKRILRWIQDSPGKAPLTSAAAKFTPDNPVGCGGVDSVSILKGLTTPCPSGRDHLRRQGKGQARENITFERSGKYRLTPGR